MTIAARVHSILAEELALDVTTIGPDISYNMIPEWDSVAHMYLIIALEETFGINFGDTEIAGLTTVSAIIAAVEHRLN